MMENQIELNRLRKRVAALEQYIIDKELEEMKNDDD